MVAVWVSALPGSVKVAGARLTVWPSLAFWLLPALTVGPTLTTVTCRLSLLLRPLLSVTTNVAVNWPLSA